MGAIPGANERECVVRLVERGGKETNETMMKKRWTPITSPRGLVE